MFFSFNQNNSGGRFNYSEASGITHWVIIEADSLDDAMDRAASIGLYFNGCDAGIDCPCCGDRWYEPWNEEGDKIPSVYGKPLNSDHDFGHRWMEEGREACVHYADGRKEWF